MDRLGDLPELSEQERVEASIDHAIADVWQALDGLDTFDREMIGQAMRCAYIRGLQNAVPWRQAQYRRAIAEALPRFDEQLKRARDGPR